MRNNDSNTIAAISTAYGEGGIGIVRMSGDMSLSIMKKIFSFNGESTNFKNRFLHYGNIIDPKTNKIIDEALVVYMAGPATYTKEDICEIYCHGSMVSLRKILELVLSLGAIPAEPGEYTKRAFLNGRIDLSQAEAVIDVIKAKSDVGFEIAVSQMEGSVTRRINELSEKLLGIVAEVVVDIDYPDEDAEATANLNLKEKIEVVIKELAYLIKNAESGKLIREGLNTVLAGKPNVGKSSLMNELLKESRAIVTDIPGTTRDTIEELVSINGIPVRLTDTAGIRETDDKIEYFGIEKTKEAFNKADLIILMLDAELGIDSYDKDIASKIGDKKCIIVINKTDVGDNISKEDAQALAPGSTVVKMSLTDYIGVDELEKEISETVLSGKVKQSESLVITNVRHKNLLEKAKDELAQAIDMLDLGEALDFVHVNINQALEYLGEITGRTIADDILDKVFADFCVGK